MRQLRFGRCLAVLGALAVVPQVTADAQTKAFTVRASEQRVVLNVTLADGEHVELTTRDGEMARLAFEGVQYGIAPYIADTSSGTIRLFVARIRKLAKTGDETLEQVGELPARLGGERVQSNTTPAFEISVKQLLPPRQAEAAGANRPEPDGICCVTCGSVRACACAVTMSCGSCCSDPCCGGGGGGDPCSPCYPDLGSGGV
jgi:hypothetical protein